MKIKHLMDAMAVLLWAKLKGSVGCVYDGTLE
jgi:hypothetical protein